MPKIIKLFILCQNLTKIIETLNLVPNQTFDLLIKNSILCQTKQWPLAPNLRDSLNTRANLARRVTFFSKMAFGECRRVWRVRSKQVGECQGVWWVRATRLGKCQQVWRVLTKQVGECRRVWHIYKKGHFGKYSNLPKMANFRRVLEFAKFGGEWPLLSQNTLLISWNSI